MEPLVYVASEHMTSRRISAVNHANTDSFVSNRDFIQFCGELD